MNIKILQIDPKSKYNCFMFCPWPFVEKYFNLDNYVEVWSGTNDDIGISTPSTDNQLNLCKIFRIFNINLPKNFTGHILTISDIVVIDDHYYYCDDYGWQLIK